MFQEVEALKRSALFVCLVLKKSFLTQRLNTRNTAVHLDNLS